MNGNRKERVAAQGFAAVWGLCVLALVFGMSLAGCGGEDDDTKKDPPGGDTDTSTPLPEAKGANALSGKTYISGSEK